MGLGEPQYGDTVSIIVEPGVCDVDDPRCILSDGPFAEGYRVFGNVCLSHDSGTSETSRPPLGRGTFVEQPSPSATRASL